MLPFTRSEFGGIHVFVHAAGLIVAAWASSATPPPVGISPAVDAQSHVQVSGHSEAVVHDDGVGSAAHVFHRTARHMSPASSQEAGKHAVAAPSAPHVGALDGGGTSAHEMVIEAA